MIGHRGETREQLFLIDFGLAKQYMDADGNHIPYKDGKNLTGTARYASIPTHKGVEQGRRDDLESIVYVMLYLKKGSLPWMGMPGKTKHEKYEVIKRRKMETGMEELCKGCPGTFRELIDLSRSYKRFD